MVLNLLHPVFALKAMAAKNIKLHMRRGVQITTVVNGPGVHSVQGSDHYVNIYLSKFCSSS